MYNFLNFHKENNIGIVTLTNPPVNALCNDMVDELDQLITEIQEDKDVKTLIITGSGEKAFMAGADINELKHRDYILGRNQTKKRQEVFNKIANSNIPVIAAINGFTLGAGLELALACTIRIGSENSKYGSPEVNLGIIPGDGATQRLPRMIGLSRAMYMIITGDTISADEALNFGLIIKKVPVSELISSAKELAENINKKGPLAIQYAKEAVNRSFDLSLSEGMLLESYLHALSCATEDKSEGVNAFIEKRKSKFNGR